jgi:hypothetical protein
VEQSRHCLNDNKVHRIHQEDWLIVGVCGINTEGEDLPNTVGAERRREGPKGPIQN